MATTTVCVPTERLIVIGVTLPVSAPSTETLAPDGNDVTLSEPFPFPSWAPALLGTSQSTPINTAIHAILRGWNIKSSLNSSHDLTFAPELARFVAYFEGTWIDSAQPPHHFFEPTKLFVFNEQEGIFHLQNWQAS